MSVERRDDLRAFRDFVDDQLAGAGPAPTPAECLDLSEIETATESERRADLQAVRGALKDMRAGDVGLPADRVLADTRRKYDLR